MPVNDSNTIEPQERKWPQQQSKQPVKKVVSLVVAFKKVSHKNPTSPDSLGLNNGSQKCGSKVGGKSGGKSHAIRRLPQLTCVCTASVILAQLLGRWRKKWERLHKRPLCWNGDWLSVKAKEKMLQCNSDFLVVYICCWLVMPTYGLKLGCNLIPFVLLSVTTRYWHPSLLWSCPFC